MNRHFLEELIVKISQQKGALVRSDPEDDKNSPDVAAESSEAHLNVSVYI